MWNDKWKEQKAIERMNSRSGLMRGSKKKKLTADIRSYKDGGYGGFFGMSKICYNFKEWAQTCRQQDKGMEFEFRKIDMIPHEDACGKAKKYS